MHYANNREAKVGDPVVGRTYNRKGAQAGVLKAVTEGSATCNACVALLEVQVVESIPGPVVAVRYVEDWTQTDYLVHAEDAYQPWFRGEGAAAPVGAGG